jgi:hypothetical protein
MYLLSERIQFVEKYTGNCYLLHVSAVGRLYIYIRGWEHSGGSLNFIVSTMEFIKFWLIFPIREQKQYNSG